MTYHFVKTGIFSAFFLAAVGLGAPASAQQNIMKECGEKWQAAKAANKTGDLTWPQFLSKCRAEASAGAARPSAAPGLVFPRAIDAKYKDLPEGQQRLRTCTDQYNANKTRGSGNGGMQWIEKGGGYWSACNKALKG